MCVCLFACYMNVICVFVSVCRCSWSAKVNCTPKKNVKKYLVDSIIKQLMETCSSAPSTVPPKKQLVDLVPSIANKTRNLEVS
jgi:hypothetical protein